MARTKAFADVEQKTILKHLKKARVTQMESGGFIDVKLNLIRSVQPGTETGFFIYLL